MKHSAKKIFLINGSASANSSNEKLITKITAQLEERFQVNIYKDLKTLPHFDPEQSIANPPESIIALRKNIMEADGLVICAPEYVFSIPSGLKNAIEWCVSTTVFSEKPTALITASASGVKAHEELQLIMSTVMARFTEDTTHLIQSIKAKFNEHGEITDRELIKTLNKTIAAFCSLVNQA
jgi:NAD(P)H-dependent FMN reductase